MFNITKDNIRKLMKPKTYKEALDLYNGNKVFNIVVNENHNDFYDANFVKINAEVMDGSGNDYTCMILFNNKTGINIIKCNCSNVKNNDICSHVGAVLIKYIDGKNNVKSDYSKRLLYGLKQSIIKREIKGKPINIEVKLHYFTETTKKSYINIRVGEDRLYVVKDVSTFLKSILENKQIKIGEKFTYYPYKYSIKKRDEELFELLFAIYHDNEDVVKDKEKSILGKNIYLTESGLSRLMIILEDRDFSILINDEGITDCYIVVDEFPKINLTIEEKEESVKLTLSGGEPISLVRGNKYVFYQGKVYKLDQYKINIYSLLIKVFSNSKVVKYYKEDRQDVLSYVYPVLKELGIAACKNVINYDYLKPKVYMDKIDENMLINIKFENNDKKLKDVNGEVYIIKILQDFGFYKDGEIIYINDSLDKMVEFMSVGLDKIQSKGYEIYYSENIKKFKVYSPHMYKGSLKVNEGNMIEVSFEIDGIDNSELYNIFEALRLKKKYYKLKEGEIVDLSNKVIKKIADMFKYMDLDYSKINQKPAILSKENAAYINRYIDEENLMFFDKDTRFERMVKLSKGLENMKVGIPNEFNSIMRDYQKRGFRWFKSLDHFGVGGILADEMGLGKTLQTIAFISSGTGHKETSIIIVPTSIVYNWKEEIEKFSKNLKTLIISGTKRERAEAIGEYYNYDVLITSYSLIRMDIEEYSKIKFKYCILDEAQYIKNKNSLITKAVKKIRAKNCFALTGTPIENCLSELWSIFDFIMPGYLLSYSKFVNKYENPIIKEKDKRALYELNRHIEPFILRRLKESVVKELPSKVEHKILIEMSQKQKEVYYAYLKNAREKIYRSIEEKGINNSKFIIFSLLTRLRQICSNPRTVVENYNGKNAKMDVLMDTIKTSIANRHRILVFSQFTSVLKSIKDKLIEKDIDVMYLDGNTKMKDRFQLADEFNKGKGEVFLISLKAGGTGLNLTGADIVVHFDPWWNPAVENQASDRAHRIGQKKNVEIIKLITRGTIEEKIYKLQQEKKKMVDNVLGDKMFSEENVLLNLDEQKIKNIFG